MLLSWAFESRMQTNDKCNRHNFGATNRLQRATRKYRQNRLNGKENLFVTV